MSLEIFILLQFVRNENTVKIVATDNTDCTDALGWVCCYENGTYKPARLTPFGRVSDIRPDESVRTGNTAPSFAHQTVSKKVFICAICIFCSSKKNPPPKRGIPIKNSSKIYASATTSISNSASLPLPKSTLALCVPISFMSSGK
jgi:hypothetical protein